MSEQVVSKSAQDFTVDFYKKIAGKSNGNLVSSALSAHVVLSMTASGAEGNTAREMHKVLHLDKAKQSDILSGFQSFIGAFNDAPNLVLRLASKIYVSNRLNVKDSFKNITSTHFRSESEQVDFANAEHAVKAVNKWCSDNTNQKIKELLKKDDVNQNTGIILLNAVYFKGDWKEKFNKNDTKSKPFYLNKTTAVDVPTMHIEKKFAYGEIEGLDAAYIALPYANKDAYMVIVVPHEIDGLKNVENKLDKVFSTISERSEFFSTTFEHIQPEVKLSLPKFKIETTIDLNSHLQELGLKEMFTEKANLRGISDQLLKVDKVVQKAFIEVNEDGSEAAAATGLVAMLMCMPPPPVEVNINRPFLYKIIYKKTTLFTGRVINPLD